MSSQPTSKRRGAHETNESVPDHDAAYPKVAQGETSSPSHPSNPSPSSNDAAETLNPSQTPSHDCSKEAEDNLSDHFDYSPPSPLISSPGPSDPSSDDSDSPSTTTNESLTQILLPLPISSPGYLTHAHQQAMGNRMTYDKIIPDGAFDTTKYTPVFLHDTLMLPGSLASLLGKESPMDIIDRLTPARLPSFMVLAHHAPPHLPCLVPSSSFPSFATGLLLLGTGRCSRQEIKARYQPVAKRVRQKVVIEVNVPISERRDGEKEKWRIEARWLEAQVFKWRGTVEGTEEAWELGKMVSGTYGDGVGEMKVVDDLGRVDGEEASEDEGLVMEAKNLSLDERSEWMDPVVFGEGKERRASEVEW